MSDYRKYVVVANPGCENETVIKRCNKLHTACAWKDAQNDRDELDVMKEYKDEYGNLVRTTEY